MPISQAHADHAAAVFDVLSEAGLGSIRDDAAAALSRRIVDARGMAIPVLAVVGGRDAAANAVSLKFRDRDHDGIAPLAEAAAAVRAVAEAESGSGGA